MALTPEDVRSKRFTPVRLREGYDMGEVDQFLDEVEAELERLYQENNDLRAQLEAAQDGSRAAFVLSEPQVEPAQPVEAVEPPVAPVPEQPEDQVPPAPEPPPVAPSTHEAQAAAAEAGATRPQHTVTEASHAAARLLEIAARNADELVNEAKDEADRIVGEARTTAERVESESRSKAYRMESDARLRAERLDHETAERRTQLFADLESERDKLVQEVDELRAFEREYRSRLRAYFEGQLAVLDGREGTHDAHLGHPGNDEGHGRLRSLLGEEA